MTCHAMPCRDIVFFRAHHDRRHFNYGLPLRWLRLARGYRGGGGASRLSIVESIGWWREALGGLTSCEPGGRRGPPAARSWPPLRRGAFEAAWLQPRASAALDAVHHELPPSWDQRSEHRRAMLTPSPSPSQSPSQSPLSCACAALRSCSDRRKATKLQFQAPERSSPTDIYRCAEEAGPTGWLSLLQARRRGRPPEPASGICLHACLSVRMSVLSACLSIALGLRRGGPRDPVRETTICIYLPIYLYIFILSVFSSVSAIHRPRTFLAARAFAPHCLRCYLKKIKNKMKLTK